MEKVDLNSPKKKSTSKKREFNMERVRLNPENAKKLRGWFRQVQKAYPSLEFSPSAVINELLVNLPEGLSKSELQRLNNKFFNKVRLSNWITEQLRLADKEGREFDPTPFLQPLLNSPAPKKRRVKTAKVESPKIDVMPAAKSVETKDG